MSTIEKVFDPTVLFIVETPWVKLEPASVLPLDHLASDLVAVVVLLREIVDILFHSEDYYFVRTVCGCLPWDHVDCFVTHE